MNVKKIVKDLTKEFLENILKVELINSLSYDKCACEKTFKENYRNEEFKP